MLKVARHDEAISQLDTEFRLLQYLMLPDVEDDIVFCHGDYCLPNVLVSGGEVSGIVDWSAGELIEETLLLVQTDYDVSAAPVSITDGLRKESR